MKIIIIILSSLLTSLWGCENGNYSDKKRHVSNNDNQPLVIIFNKNSLLKERKKGDFYMVNKISYYNENMFLKEVDLNNYLKNDTITISTNKQYLAVDLFSNYVIYNYHFKKGDTILFSFKNNIPIAKDRMNSPYYDLNYTLEYKKKFSLPLIGDNVMSFKKDTVSTRSKFNIIKQTFTNQQHFIDSLDRTQKISLYTSTFFRNQNNFEFFSHAIVNTSFTPYFTALAKKFDNNEMLNDKRYFYNGYFHKFIIWRYLWSQKLGVKQVRSSSGISLDYKQVYQLSKKIFSDTTLQHSMLLYSLQMIKEDEPNDVFKSYQRKFKADVSNSFYQTYLADNPTSEIDTKPGSSILISKGSSRKSEFNELIKSLSGQVVYVDLWASWCLPCRASMPASHQLKKRFSSKKVSFVYLSIDEKFANWEQASKEEGLSSAMNNFLLINPKESGILKQIGLKTIPRYLLFDKNGKLVHQNAPGPTSVELVKMLNKYL